MHSPKDQNKKPQVNSWIHGQMKFTKILRQQNREKVVSSKISWTQRQPTEKLQIIYDKELIHEVYMQIPQLKSKTNNNIKDK